MWNNFWNFKTNRKLFFKVSDNVKNVQQVKSRVWFLSQCYRFKVCPKTLRSKTIPPNTMRPETMQMWRQHQEKEQQGYIKLAHVELKQNLLRSMECLGRAQYRLSENIDNEDLKIIIDEKLEEVKKRTVKQANNDHRVKLRNLLIQAGEPIPGKLQSAAHSHLSLESGLLSDLSLDPDKSEYHTVQQVTSTPVSRPPRPHLDSSPLPSNHCELEKSESAKSHHKRKFTKRQLFRRRIVAKLKSSVNLWTNYSSHVLTPAQSQYLNLGLNFVFQPKKFNRTEVEASLMQWERAMRWKEFWHKHNHENQEDTTEEEDEQIDIPDNIFKDKTKKTNLPRKHPVPAALKSCIAATRYDVVGADLNRVQQNISPSVQAAGKDLAKLQQERVITIKLSDKTGGKCLLDFEDYKSAMEEKLQEKFVTKDGIKLDKYVRCKESDLKQQWLKVKKAVEQGRAAGFITDSDAKIMVPDNPKEL